MYIKKEMGSKYMPEGVSLLYKLISNTVGYLPIIPVLPEIVKSINNAVNYIYSGEGKEHCEFSLVSSKPLLKVGTQSKGKNENRAKNCSHTNSSCDYNTLGTIDREEIVSSKKKMKKSHRNTKEMEERK